MKIYHVRRLVVAMAVVLALWAVVLLPLVIAPGAARAFCERYLPAGVTRRVDAWVNRSRGEPVIPGELVTDEQVPPEMLSLQDFGEIIYRFTGAWPTWGGGNGPGPIESPLNDLTVLVILAPAEAGDGSGVALVHDRRTRISHALQVGEFLPVPRPTAGGGVEMVEAEVVRMDPYCVWLRHEEWESVLRRANMADEERQQVRHLVY